MTARYVQKETSEGRWARRIAIFFIQLLALTVLLHRFAGLSTPVAINLLIVSVAGLLIAVAIAAFCLARIWVTGNAGAREAFAGIAVAVIGLAVPGWAVAEAVMLPRLNDIATTPRDPLPFKELASARPADANPIKTPDEKAIAEQEKAYPDIRPMQLERSELEVFDMVTEAVHKLHWKVVATEAPDEGGNVGEIEATDRTMIMGFTDDVVVRVTGDDAHAEIDARSVSRYGVHDLGANANRIRALFTTVKSELEKGEGGIEPPKKLVQQPAKRPPHFRKRARRRPRVSERPPTAEAYPQW